MGGPRSRQVQKISILLNHRMDARCDKSSNETAVFKRIL